MSKKRRTKAQKERAAQRRQIVPQSIESSRTIDTEIPGFKKVEPKTIPIQAISEPVNAETEVSVAARSSSHDLRTSLIIFGSLIAAEVVLWLIFRFTTIDNHIYNLIKL